MKDGDVLEVEPAPPRPPGGLREWRLPALLFAATCASTLWVGSAMENAPGQLWAGLPFALPLMAILLSHEMGHYIAGRLHRIDISPPYFIPMPFMLLGTMGAVIRMRGAIRSRNALLDVGAAGPLAGMVVALPVLVYGIATSPVTPLPSRTAETQLILEGHSLLYEALLYLLKGPIPEGSDISLTSTALAGWAGLLVTMINLVPFGQLDGGHVAYALLGPRQDKLARWVPRLLPLVAVATGAWYGGKAMLARLPWETVATEALAGWHWLLWAVVLRLMVRVSGWSHPPTEDATLSPGRRWVARFTLALFVLLFMPSWVRVY